MRRGSCQVCEKSLQDDPAPVLMDRQGYRYHFLCWRNLMDVRIQENREAIATHRSRSEATKRKLSGAADGDSARSPDPA